METPSPLRCTVARACNRIVFPGRQRRNPARAPKSERAARSASGTTALATCFQLAFATFCSSSRIRFATSAPGSVNLNLPATFGFVTVVPPDWDPPGAPIYRWGAIVLALTFFGYVAGVDRLLVLIGGVAGAVLVAGGLVVRESKRP